MTKTDQKAVKPKVCGKKYRTTPFAKVKDADGREWPKALPIFVMVNTRKTQNNEACPCGKRKGNRPMKFKNCCKSK